jgi:hypothetical protein
MCTQQYSKGSRRNAVEKNKREITPKPREIKPTYLSVADAEAMSSISKWTWRRWAYEGKVASVKLGRRLVIPVAEIERLVTEGTRPSTEIAEA